MASKDKSIKSLLNKDFFSSTLNCYLAPFIILFGCYIYYLIDIGKPIAGGYYLIHYLYTYEHGFNPRGLLGEVIRWFSDTVSDEMISNIANTFSVLLIIAVSLCIGKALNKLKDDRERFNWVVLLAFICCVLPTSLKMYFGAIHLDKILWLLSLIAVFISDRKYAVWFVPVLCVIATLVNPMYLFGSMILVAIILLQQFYSEHYSFKKGLLCFLTYASMIVIGLYSPIAEKKLGFSTPQELVDFYFSRYGGTLSRDTYSNFVTEWLFDYFEPIDEVFRSAFKYYFVGWSNGQKCFFYFLLVALPAYILLGIIWIRAIKNEKNKFQKFIYFLCLISPVIIIAPLIVSWEMPRYFSDNFITQLCLLAYFIVKGHPAIISSVRSMVDFCKRNFLITAIAVLYFVVLIVL